MEVQLTSRSIHQQLMARTHMGRILVTCPIHTEVLMMVIFLFNLLTSQFSLRTFIYFFKKPQMNYTPY